MFLQYQRQTKKKSAKELERLCGGFNLCVLGLFLAVAAMATMLIPKAFINNVAAELGLIGVVAGAIGSFLTGIGILHLSLGHRTVTLPPVLVCALIPGINLGILLVYGAHAGEILKKQGYTAGPLGAKKLAAGIPTPKT